MAVQTSLTKALIPKSDRSAPGTTANHRKVRSRDDGSLAQKLSARTAAPCMECSLASTCIARISRFSAMHDAPPEVRHYAVGSNDRVIAHGELMTGVLMLRKGTVKTCLIARDGREQVVDFQFSGELIGLEAMDQGRHWGETIALEHSEFCHLSITELMASAVQSETVQRQLLASMSQQLNRATHLAADLTAEERIAIFVLDVWKRSSGGQGGASRFKLAMSRTDIANHLRLAAETVSRVLGRFRTRGWLELRGRVVVAMDCTSLERVRRDAPGGGR